MDMTTERLKVALSGILSDLQIDETHISGLVSAADLSKALEEHGSITKTTYSTRTSSINSEPNKQGMHVLTTL